MSIAIIADPKQKNQIMPLVNKAEEIFDKSVYAPVNEIRIKTGGESKILHKSIDLLSFGCILPIPSPENIDIFLSIASILEDDEVYMPYSLEGLLLFQRKALGISKLRENGFSVPNMHYLLSDKTVEGILNQIEFPVLLSVGHKSYKVDDKRHLIGMVRLRRPGQGIMISEVLEDPVIECLVVGNEVIASVERTRKLRSIKVGSSLQQTAVSAVHTLKSDYGIISFSGDKIVSFSLSPDFNVLEKVTVKSVSSSLLHHMEQNAKLEEEKTVWKTIMDALKVNKVF